MKFYKCDVCGKIIIMLEETAVPTVCCGQEMKELVPQSADSSVEKHVPVIEADEKKVKVTVGSTLHPMMEKHYIKWIILETSEGFYKRDLKPEMEPSAGFKITKGEKSIAAYEFCNIHGLWKAEV